MSYSRIKLDNVKQIVFRRAHKIRTCINCGHDIDYSLNECCVEKRKDRANRSAAVRKAK
jgi:hypothetical protein